MASFTLMVVPVENWLRERLAEVAGVRRAKMQTSVAEAAK